MHTNTSPAPECGGECHGGTINCQNAKAVKRIKLLTAVPVLVSLFGHCGGGAAALATNVTEISPTNASLFTHPDDDGTLIVGRANFSQMTTSPWSPTNSTPLEEEPPNLMSLASVQIFFGILYAFIFVVGIVGNVLVCYVVFRNRAMQTVTNYFITNLALSDILLCILAVPFTPLYTFLERWVFGSPLCHIVPYAQGCSVYISTLTLTAVAIDRFFVIVYPFQPRMKLSVCIYIIVSIWVFALLVTLPYGLYMRIQEDAGDFFCEEDWPEPTSIKIIFSICTTMLQFAIPFLMITVCYVCVSIKLNDRAKLKPGSKTSKREEADRDRKKRTNRMLIAMVAVFGISWMPLNVFNIRADLKPNEDGKYSMLIFFMTHAIAMSSTCYNPFLYAWLNENFRKEFIQILPCLSRALSPLSSTAGTSSRNNAQNRSRRGLGPTSTYDPERLPTTQKQTKADVEVGGESECGKRKGEGEGQQRLLLEKNNNDNYKCSDSKHKKSNCDSGCRGQPKDGTVLGMCSKLRGNVLSKKARDPAPGDRLSTTHIPLVDPISSYTSSSCTTATTSTTVSGQHQTTTLDSGKVLAVSQLASPQKNHVDAAIVTVTNPLDEDLHECILQTTTTNGHSASFQAPS